MIKRIKVLAKILGFIGCIVVAICFITLIIIVPMWNDCIAKKIMEKLISIPLPDRTEFVDGRSIAGNLVGNGNGMQYLGVIELKSELSGDDLREYYEIYAGDTKIYCEKLPLTGELKNFFYETETRGDDYFIVYSWGEGNEFLRDWDIRGH